MRKTLLELRRRAWVVILATALVLASAFLLAKAIVSKYSAESVLVVQASGPLAGEPDASIKLAATYAPLIPLDSQLRETLEHEIPDYAGTHLSASNDANTAVLRIVAQSPHATSAIATSTAAARAVSGASPRTKTIAPRTISIVRLPRAATNSRASTTEILIAAGVLGCLLGLLLTAFWRARDRRIDDVKELRREVECQCMRLDPRSGESIETLIAVLARREHDGVVALVPATPRECGTAQFVRAAIAPPLAAARISIAGAPGGEEVGELAALGADVVVFVVSPGTPSARVADSLDLLRRYGTSPNLALLASRSGWSRIAPVDEAPESVSASRTVA